MQPTTIDQHQVTRNLAAAFWLVAGVTVLIASGDALAVLVAAVAIVVVVWEMTRAIEHRVRNRAQLAAVTQLRPASTARPQSSVHGSWRGTRAA